MERIVLGMAALRFLSAGIEFTAATLMLYFGRVETAFKINALLALIGPTIMVSVTALGLVGLAATKLSPTGMLYVIAGIGFIFMGLRHF